INEPIVAEFRLYFRSDAVRRYGNPQLPLQANGLTFSKLVESQLFQRRVGNAVFTVLPLSVSITPFKTGTLPIGPVNGSIVLNNPDIMDGFFSPAMTPQQVALTSDALPLQVSPLPTENVPAGFNGAVGQYTMSVTAGPTNVMTGDP